jgi:hypothetical protein
MSTKNRVEEAKSFLSRNSVRLALRVVPMALVAVAAAHATPNFNAPNNNTVSTCSGGTKTGTLAGVSVNGGHGLSLSGNATLSHPTFSDCLNLDWKGTGSGTLDTGTLPLLFDFTISPPANVPNPSWVLQVIFTNADTTVTTVAYACNFQAPPIPALVRRDSNTITGLPCTGVISGRNFTVPDTQGATLASYEVKLTINAAWSDNNPTTLSVTVPPASSININAPLSPPVTVPALSPIALAITVIGLLAIGLYLAMGRRSSGGLAA